MVLWGLPLPMVTFFPVLRLNVALRSQAFKIDDCSYLPVQTPFSVFLVS
jgi:hypothetical protein